MDMSRHNGFALIELVVALVIGAMVLLGARDVLVQLAATAHTVQRRGRDADRTANRERVLRELLANVEVGTSDAQPFAGTADSAMFSSWCAVPAGWLRRCAVVLALALRDSGQDQRHRALVARVDGRRIDLGGAMTHGRLLYLASAGNGGQWFDRWSGGVSAPLAIGIIEDDDTVIVRIGGI